MVKYLVRRFFTMIVTVFVISILSFLIINQPPGDYVDRIINQINTQGGASPSPDAMRQLRQIYGLNDSTPVQYYKWISKIVLHG